jgi:ribonuclease HI
LKFKVRLASGSNNHAELMALNLSLLLAIEEGVAKIQIFGDSLAVINWMWGIYALEKLLPRLISNPL